MPSLRSLAAIDILERDSGLHFLMRIHTARSDEELRSLLAERGINLLSIRVYYHRPEDAPEHTFILNYSSLTPSDLELALRELAEII